MPINTSVVKVFKVAETLSQFDSAGVTELAEASGLDKSTVYRLLTTLKELGYAAQDSQTQRYMLTNKFVGLVRPYLGLQDLSERTRPILEQLQAATGEAANLAVLDGANIVYLGHVEAKHTIKVNVAVGKRFPAYAVGTGKSILAYLPEEEVDSIFQGVNFEPLTPFTITSLEKLKTDLIKIRKNGYAVDNEECSEGLFCIAAPVFNREGRAVAAMSVGFPKFRHPTPASRKEIMELVKKGAAAVSGGFGFNETLV